MMRDWGKPSGTADVLLEAKGEDDIRVRSVWRFVIVTWLTWLFFACFLWLRGYDEASQVCTVTAVSIAILNSLLWQRNCFSWVMNLNLIASAVGLFLVSTSNSALHGTMLFYPVSILIASQLLGVRVAFIWFLVSAACFSLFYFIVYGVHRTFQSSLADELVLLLGVAACVYFCCQQGEVFYQLRTKSLLKLSRDLEAKSNTLEVLATTDALTGLLNRFQFQERLREQIQDCHRTSKRLALFLIDMDGFKQINDTLGHPVGDAALTMIANRLQANFGETSDVARLGGDEFCIITPDLENAEQATAIAQRIHDSLNDRYVFSDTAIAMSVSIGYCLCPEQCTTDTKALSYADTAMFHAKENRLGYSRYEPEMTDRLIEYQTSQQKLAVALQQNEFFLVYQPQIDLKTGSVLGVEALLRWENEGQIVSPAYFIPLLEKSGEIVAVSNWIVREVCQQLSQWNAIGFDLCVSINVSALQFNDPQFYNEVLRAVVDFDIDAGRLDFEITEGHLIDDLESAFEKLSMIKQLGATVSIDDFGTGYSSLSYLRQFPVDRLKIDRSFVTDIPDRDDGAIASTVIMLAKTLGLRVLAEGVETKEQLRFLVNQECDEYQGYYFSKPVSAAEVSSLLCEFQSVYSVDKESILASEWDCRISGDRDPVIA